ncbi:MAG: hypothetical protein ACK5X7_21290 [Pseudanabaena sp.]
MQLSPRFKLFSQPLDRYAIGLAAFFGVSIAKLLFVGDRTPPQVRDFILQSQMI